MNNKSILEINMWGEDNIDRFVEIIKDNNLKYDKVFLNCLDDNDYPRMGGSKTFLDNCLEVCYEKKIPVILAHLYSEKYNPVKKYIDIPKEYFKKVEWCNYYIHKTFQLKSIKNNYNYNKNLNFDLFDNSVCLNSTLEYDYITLNNIAKDHRCMLMDLLEKYKLINNGAIAWRNVNREYDNIEDSLKNTKYKYQYWKPKRLLLDQQEFYCIKNQEHMVKEYNQAFMQVVTESEDRFFLLSEKTAVPLLFNKPFLVVSSRNFHSILKDMGFKLYDDIFDYHFDSCNILSDRIEGIIKNLLKIKNMSILEKREALLAIKEKLLYNRMLAIKMVFDDIPSEIMELIPHLERFRYMSTFNELRKNVY